MSTEIREISHFEYDGHKFNRLQEVAVYVENQLGAILDSTPNRLSARDRLDLFAALVTHRRKLVQLLSTTFLDDDARPHSIFELIKKS